MTFITTTWLIQQRLAEVRDALWWARLCEADNPMSKRNQKRRKGHGPRRKGQKRA